MCCHPPTLGKILDEVLPSEGMEAFAVTPTIIMDRGIATKDNISRLRKRKLNYAVVERHQDLDVFIDEFKGDRSQFNEVNR